MAKFRVWARSITDVYIDVEAKDKYEARARAELLDGGDFVTTPYGDWEYGTTEELDDNALVNFDNEYFEEMEDEQ